MNILLPSISVAMVQQEHRADGDLWTDGDFGGAPSAEGDDVGHHLCFHSI
jgi:hypothetical protein